MLPKSFVLHKSARMAKAVSLGVLLEQPANTIAAEQTDNPRIDDIFIMR